MGLIQPCPLWVYILVLLMQLLVAAALTHLSVGLGRSLGFAAVVRHHGLAPRHLEGHQVLHDGVESLPLI